MYELRRIWTGAGLVLIAAAIAQPIVAAQLSGLSLDEILAVGPGPSPASLLPPEARAMFAGVQLNVEFAWAFSAVKLSLGAAILWAAARLGARPAARRVLQGASWLFIAAFAAIAATFAATMGIAAAAVPHAAWLYAGLGASGALVALAPIVFLRKGQAALARLA